MNRILVVDDDANIRELVCTVLRRHGFEADGAADGREALKRLGEGGFDLCVLDIMMPGMDGYELCGHCKKYYADMPVLMLTAKGETSQKVRGFTCGADDYLTKPFAPEELVVRVRALLKRYNIAASQSVQCGRVLVDKNRMSVVVDGAVQEIPLKEFELLFQLASYPGQTLSRDRLIEDVWGYDFAGNERTLDVHVGRLRERFDEKTCGFAIKTVRGLGYRLEVLE